MYIVGAGAVAMSTGVQALTWADLPDMKVAVMKNQVLRQVLP